MLWLRQVEPFSSLVAALEPLGVARPCVLSASKHTTCKQQTSTTMSPVLHASTLLSHLQPTKPAGTTVTSWTGYPSLRWWCCPACCAEQQLLLSLVPTMPPLLLLLLPLLQVLVAIAGTSPSSQSTCAGHPASTGGGTDCWLPPKATTGKNSGQDKTVTVSEGSNRS